MAGAVWRPGWSLLSDSHVVRPRDLFLQRSWPTRSVQGVAASHSQSATVGGSRAFLLAVVWPPACPSPRDQTPSLAPAAPIGAAPAPPPLGTESKSPPKPRGRVGGRPPPLRCRSPAASLPSTGVTPRTPCCDRGTPTEHTLSRTGAACALSLPRSRVGDLALTAADQQALEDGHARPFRAPVPRPVRGVASPQQLGGRTTCSSESRALGGARRSCTRAGSDCHPSPGTAPLSGNVMESRGPHVPPS